MLLEKRLYTLSTLITHFLAISRTRISCHAALDEAAGAPFRKERRMKFAKATKFHRKFGGTRISCHAALDEAAGAPFRKERRMKFAKATKFHRKFGGTPPLGKAPTASGAQRIP
jgi:hypothetical protein